LLRKGGKKMIRKKKLRGLLLALTNDLECKFVSGSNQGFGIVCKAGNVFVCNGERELYYYKSENQKISDVYHMAIADMQKGISERKVKKWKK